MVGGPLPSSPFPGGLFQWRGVNVQKPMPRGHGFCSTPHYTHVPVSCLIGLNRLTGGLVHHPCGRCFSGRPCGVEYARVSPTCGGCRPIAHALPGSRGPKAFEPPPSLCCCFWVFASSSSANSPATRLIWRWNPRASIMRFLIIPPLLRCSRGRFPSCHPAQIRF